MFYNIIFISIVLNYRKFFKYMLCFFWMLELVYRCEIFDYVNELKMFEIENYFILGGLVYVINVLVMVVILVYFFLFSKLIIFDD